MDARSEAWKIWKWNGPITDGFTDKCSPWIIHALVGLAGVQFWKVSIFTVLFSYRNDMICTLIYRTNTRNAYSVSGERRCRLCKKLRSFSSVSSMNQYLSLDGKSFVCGTIFLVVSLESFEGCYSVTIKLALREWAEWEYVGAWECVSARWASPQLFLRKFHIASVSCTELDEKTFPISFLQAGKDVKNLWRSLMMKRIGSNIGYLSPSLSRWIDAWSKMTEACALISVVDDDFKVSPFLEWPRLLGFWTTYYGHGINTCTDPCFLVHNL